MRQWEQLLQKQMHQITKEVQQRVLLFLLTLVNILIAFTWLPALSSDLTQLITLMPLWYTFYYIVIVAFINNLLVFEIRDDGQCWRRRTNFSI